MFNVPILFLVFNRLDTTERVFEAIKKQRPKFLYVAADGPRSGEKEKTDEVRAHILDNIDWDCEVKTLFRDNNLGCGRAVSQAITWFFENVEEGIILEDDTLPNSSFFDYCEKLLEYHRDDEKVMVVSGNNFQQNNGIVKEPYYFSNHVHIWGWATWRSAWEKYDFEMSRFDREEIYMIMKRKGLSLEYINYWLGTLERCYQKEIDTWDFQWMYAIWRSEGLTALPNVNLVSNIGFDENATHTKQESWFSKLPTEELRIEEKNNYFTVNAEADNFTTIKVLGIKNGGKRVKNMRRKIRKILSFIVPEGFKEIYRARNPEYKLHIKYRGEKDRLNELPRYQNGIAIFSDLKIHFADATSLVHGFEEIFEQEIYKFKPKTENPLIIDCGANIGLATIYFKQKYKKSKVLAFEPDPGIFNILKKNIENLGFDNVELFQKAIWVNNDGISFNQEGGFSGRIPYNETESNTTTVPTARLKDVLSSISKVDFLKIDIEGAENKVIFDIADELDTVQNIFIEYHSHQGEEQMLSEILLLLKQKGFRCHIQEAFVRQKPFVDKNLMVGMDLQLNIFGYRNE